MKRLRAIPRSKSVVAPPKLRISAEALARAKVPHRRKRRDASMVLNVAHPMPGVLPKGRKLAMDSGLSSALSWGGAQLSSVALDQGYAFLGYAVLAEMAQVPEYRLISEVIATEMTRKWIKIQSTSDDKDKTEKIKQLEEEMKRLRVRETFQTVAEQDGFFGRAHLYIDTGDADDRNELVTSIGDGTQKFTARKIKKGAVRALKTVEPVWAYPANYNANDPFADNWYKPDIWFVMSKEIHCSRFLTFVGRPVPDLFKPSFSFGGLSLTQMAKATVDNWLQTRESVSDLVQAFSTMVLKTDMQSIMQGGGEELFARLDLFNDIRNNRGVMALSNENEEFANVSVPLGTLDKLQAQAQEHICSISRIPLVKYTGLSPTGLNASSEGEIQSFYDTIHAYQEKFFDPHLWTIFRLAQINIWGTVDDDLTFEYEPLWELSAEQLATKRKTEADTDALYIDKGVLSPEESRQRLADDPASEYSNLDVNDLPETDEPLPENVTDEPEKDPAQAAPGPEADTEQPPAPLVPLTER